MADQDVLDLIKKYESGGRNVPNYMYSETPDESGLKHTAQGYYQITNTNWQNYAPKVGIDLGKYPNAMAATEEDQRKVASYLLNQTPGGIHNWSENKRLMASLSEQGITMPQDIQQVDSATDLSNLSLEQLQELKKKLESQVPPPPPSGRGGTTDTGGGRGGAGGGQQKIIVKPPEKGWWQKFAEEGDPSSTFAPSQAFGLVPGTRKLTRAATGYGLPPGATWKTRAAEGIEGLGDISLPIGVTAGTIATGGALGGALAGGAGLGEAALAGGGAALPYLTGAAGSAIGSQLGSAVAPELSSDPETQRLIVDLGGLGGGIAGGYGPRVARTPIGRAAIAAGVGHATGHPWIGDIIAGEEAFGLRGMLQDFIRSKMPGGGRTPGGRGVPTNLGTVAAPGKPLPRTTVEDDMLRTGALTPDQYVTRMKDMGMADDTANAKLAHAQRTGAETNARAAGNRGRTAQGPVTITPTEEQLRSSTNPQGPVTVNIPPGLKVQTTAPPTGPVNPPPSGTAAMAPQNFPPQAPVPPPAPGSLGTVGPLGPTPQGPPLQGPAPTGTPISPPLGQPPVQPPVTPTRPAVPTSTLDLPVRPPGEIPRPVTPPTGPVPTRTPTGTMPPTDFERSSQEVYRIARKLGQAPPITSNKLTLTRWQKLLGFLPTRDQMIEGRRLYHDWVKSGRPTATNPTDADLK